jgi:anaerobic selenocysteine-containing dehydrogenase
LRDSPEGVEIATSVPLDAHRQPAADGFPRGFPTPTKRIEVYSERLLEHGYAPVPAFSLEQAAPATPGFPLRLGAAKTAAFCHSQHRNVASLRRLEPDPILEMPPGDAEARSIGDGDWVRIRTAAGVAVARARLVPGLAAGTVFGQHGWWVDGPPGSPYGPDHRLAANLNQVVDTRVADPVSGSIPLRCSWCEVERLDGTA